jgi:hypothetical protein
MFVAIGLDVCDLFFIYVFYIYIFYILFILISRIQMFLLFFFIGNIMVYYYMLSFGKYIIKCMYIYLVITVCIKYIKSSIS